MYCIYVVDGTPGRDWICISCSQCYGRNNSGPRDSTARHETNCCYFVAQQKRKYLCRVWNGH